MNSGLVILDLCEVGGGYMPKRVALLTLGAEPGRDTVDITELAEMDKSSGQIPHSVLDFGQLRNSSDSNILKHL
jgi:hypothetical protein